MRRWQVKGWCEHGVKGSNKTKFKNKANIFIQNFCMLKMWKLTGNNYFMVNKNNRNHEIFKCPFSLLLCTNTRKAFRHQKQQNLAGRKRTRGKDKNNKHTLIHCARNERSNTKQLSEEVFYYVFSFVLFYLADSCFCPRHNRCSETKLNITTEKC